MAEGVTSFLESQQDWGKQRENRPAVLFRLYKPQARVAVDPGFLFTPSPSTAFPELHVVVDARDGKPLRNFPFLPSVISTEVEGWLLEAWMRLDAEIKIDHIMARMPHLTAAEWSNSRDGGGFKNTLSARRRDFRKVGRCISWEDNSARRSPFDRKLFADVASNPAWHMEQTTRFLEDLPKEEKDRLQELTRKESQAKRERKRKRAQPEGEDSSSESGGEEGAEKRPRRDNGQPANPPSINPPAWSEQNAMPLTDPLGAPTLHHLVAWLAARGVIYQPTSPIPPAPQQQDARFTPATSSEERRQLFLALYPAVLEAASSRSPRRFVVDLSMSYATAYNSVQNQFVYVTYLVDNNANLREAEERLDARTAWAGEIGDFDIADLGAVEVASAEEREAAKTNGAQYIFSPDFQQRALLEGRLGGDGDLEMWPDKVVVEALLDERMEWILELVDFE